MMLLVLVFGGGLGWYAYQVRLQREAVAAITRVGGSVRYDWEADDDGKKIPNASPGLPAWFRSRVGPDWLESVRCVSTRQDLASDLGAYEMRQLGHLPRLRRLNLWSGLVSDSDLATLRNLGELRWLSLVLRGPATGGALANLRSMGRLKSLSIQLEKPLTDADLAHLAGLRSLEELKFRGPLSVSDDGLAQLRGLVNLRVLSLSAPTAGTGGITDAGLDYLGAMSQLQALSLAGSRITNLGPMRPLRRLETLSLGLTRVDDAGLEPLVGHPGLRFLSLRRTAITDHSLAHLAKIPQLINLDLQGTAITDDGLTQLRDSPLGTLNVSGTAITDDGLAILAGMRDLTSLNLEGTGVTDSGLMHLSGSDRLESINVSGTKVTPGGVVAFQKAKPRAVEVILKAPNRSRWAPLAPAAPPIPSARPAAP